MTDITEVTFRQIFSNEPTWLFAICGIKAIQYSIETAIDQDIFTSSLDRISPLDYYDIPWIAKELTKIEQSPSTYEHYVDFFNEIPITSIVIIIFWLERKCSKTCKKLKYAIDNSTDVKHEVLRYRMREAHQKTELSNILQPLSIDLIRKTFT